MLHLTQRQARALMLAAQGLLEPPARPATKADVLDAIRRMGALQIDTINVVARSPYFVLWSRLGQYDPGWLDELLAEGALFEYWGHEASFLPMEDYGLFRRQMVDDRWRNERWVSQLGPAIDTIRAHVIANGPTRSADFERTDGKKGNWWNWKPEKQALDLLHTAGELMIARRQNFQRVYDLRERVHPAWSDDALPAADEVWRALALKAVRALGVTAAGWVADYFRTPKAPTAAAVKHLTDGGQLIAVEVEGWPAGGFVHLDNLPLAEAAAAGDLQPAVTTLLSPFDPITWDRARARATFAFDYQIECYTPAAKRRYGYFSLPILHRDSLAGRLDAKAHRKEGVFEVKSVHLEAETDPEALVVDLAGAIHRCADWHKTPLVVVRESSPAGFGALLQAALDG